uniref:hypothetical protein n=1 Tax=Eisenbergiella tayi TaxID=1432052 RepID=UPI003FF07890
MKIRIAAAEDIPEIEELYRQLFAAMAEIQPEFIRPGSQDESFIRMNMESEEEISLPPGRKRKWLAFFWSSKSPRRPMSALFRIVLPVSWILQLMKSTVEKASGPV